MNRTARLIPFARWPHTGQQLAVALNPDYLQSFGASLLAGSDPLGQIVGQELQTAAQQIRSGTPFSSDDFQRVLNLIAQGGGDPSKAILSTVPPAPPPAAPSPSTIVATTTTTSPPTAVDSEKFGAAPPTAAKRAFPFVPVLLGLGVLGGAAYVLTRKPSRPSTTSRR